MRFPLGPGFIRSAYTGVVGAMAVAGTTTAVWQSPGFTYSGAEGASTGAVSFALDRRASVDQLLAVAGSSAEYSVQLIDLSAGGESVPLIGPTTLAGARSWTNVRRSIEPADLTVGDSYRIQIVSRYTSGTSVLASGNADYDNVVLSAIQTDGGGGNSSNGAGSGSGKMPARSAHSASKSCCAERHGQADRPTGQAEGTQTIGAAQAPAGPPEGAGGQGGGDPLQVTPVDPA